MQTRTPRQLAHWQANFRRLAEVGEMVQRAAESGKTWAHGVSGGGPSFTQEEVDSAANADVGALVFPLVEAQLEILSRMSLWIFETSDPLGFITSDAPCVWFDPSSRSHSPGLGSPTVEVSLPASPQQMLMLSWRPPGGYVMVPNDVLNTLNRRTRWRAREHFVVCQNQVKPEWF
jgi:hypothetical protein